MEENTKRFGGFYLKMSQMTKVTYEVAGNIILKAIFLTDGTHAYFTHADLHIFSLTFTNINLSLNVFFTILLPSDTFSIKGLRKLFKNIFLTL